MEDTCQYRMKLLLWFRVILALFCVSFGYNPSHPCFYPPLSPHHLRVALEPALISGPLAESNHINPWLGLKSMLELPRRVDTVLRAEPIPGVSESRTEWGLRIHFPRESLRAAAAVAAGLGWGYAHANNHWPCSTLCPFYLCNRVGI